MTPQEGAEYLQTIAKSLDEKMETDGEKVAVYAKNQEQSKTLGELTKKLGDPRDPKSRGIIPDIVNATQYAVNNNPDGLIRAGKQAYDAQEAIKGLKDYVNKARGKFKQALVAYLTGLYLDAQKALDTVKTVANTPVMAPQVDKILKMYHSAVGR